MLQKDQPIPVGKTKETTVSEDSTTLFIAEQIKKEVEEGLEAHSLDTTQAAGLDALANLLIKVSEGLLSPTQEFILQKSLADKKTPSPAQKIEQQTKVDFNVTISEAIKANAPALQSSLEKAKAHNLTVLEKLGGNLMLEGDTEEKVVERRVSEPYELTDLRGGGDGSVKIQSFRDRIQRQGD